MAKNIFRLSVFFILSAAVLAVITPILSINNLLYPVRIDSSYVAQQQIAYEKQRTADENVSTQVFLYGPDQLKINYIDVSLTMKDSTILKGWLAIDTTRMQSPLLFIIPDITEGAINYLSALKQFCDRGFHVCVMNLRGQGNSGGDFYNPGNVSVTDVNYMLEQVKQMPFIGKVALLGTGTGAGIALKVVAQYSSADVVVLQNLPLSLRYLMKKKVETEWGSFVKPFFPVVMRSYEKNTGIHLKEYNYLEIIKKLYTPHLLVTANFLSKKDIEETVKIYNASTYFNKRLYIDTETYLKPTGLSNSKKYYDKISTYINRSLPSTKKRSRFGRLASR
ncbi:MAG: alpha/beta hydrolase [Bacteroidetes bacterium]|nr:alpha/beta hydrolase [Bacteroidota bacterium]